VRLTKGEFRDETRKDVKSGPATSQKSVPKWGTPRFPRAADIEARAVAQSCPKTPRYSCLGFGAGALRLRGFTQENGRQTVEVRFRPYKRSERAVDARALTTRFPPDDY
jgi:hypothetical protein